MSTGKRLAKRSIIGTRVCAPGIDGRYYSGVIQKVKTPPALFPDNSNCIHLTPNTRYSVRFDDRQGSMGKTIMEYTENDLVGPGFRNVTDVTLVKGQKVYVTYNGREVTGELKEKYVTDDVKIVINTNGTDEPITVIKKIDDVRLLESRKSARLADQDTDFARLADMAGDRKRAASNTIDVPLPSNHHNNRKRTSSFCQDRVSSPNPMDDCSAAMVLLYLSASPPYAHELSPGSSSSNSSRSTPSPPSPHESQLLYMDSSPDEGVFMESDMPKRKKKYPTLGFRCLYRGCQRREVIEDLMCAHVRDEHSNCPGDEIFYYDDIKEEDEEEHHSTLQAPQPTLSHFDLTRPPHEDPEYQRQLVGTIRQKMMGGPIPLANKKMSPPGGFGGLKMSASPRRARGDSKKCRKVYGMDNKDQWCTQCKWKKACTRFVD
ncbi:zinc finger protein 395 [Onthophagus taurus]|uniref:zinc finger protein 395 n=1 Tax=Onthophagus taurus TaxID=166361 RepID=UPI000C2083B9|nr:zinc finger protein 704 [Onthophagus taurus]